MTEPRYADAWLTIWQGDCRAVLAELPAESVHTVVTSPPYWALRDYGTATWVGGEDPACDHRLPVVPRSSRPPGLLHGGTATIDAQDAGKQARAVCPRCGARREDQQLGLEPTPEAYVQALVDIFREVRRVLRRDGTVWLNLGDSYAGSWGAQSRGNRNGADKTTLDGHPDGLQMHGRQIQAHPKFGRCTGTRALQGGRKPKDMTGIPWMVAFALRSDGWYLRRDVIWAKPNPMPESVEDRPTSAHEYVFMLTRSERYFYDHVAVRRPDTGQDHARLTLAGQASLEPSGGLRSPHRGLRRAEGRNGAGANLRSVWSIATEPYGGNHFATYPRKLVEPCVLAGTSAAGVCPDCGAPWRRVVGEAVPTGAPGSGNKARKVAAAGERSRLNTHLGSSVPWVPVTIPTTGWQPSCGHELEPVPATVLDPFGGTGTTALAAEALGRRTVLIELNDDSIDQALKRVASARYDREGHTVDMPIAPPDDSIWALADEREEVGA